MTNYGNRGMSLETYVEYANQRYRAYGEGIVTKQHTKFIPIWNPRTKKMDGCKVEEKATVDFMGRYRNIPVAIETKHTKSDRIKFSEVQDHQARFLNEFVGEFGLGFGAVLVSFNLERFFLVPWHFWSRARDLWQNNKGAKETLIFYGMAWTTTGKASVSAEEMHPSWEVKPNNEYVLPYLSKIDEYVQPF